MWMVNCSLADAIGSWSEGICAVCMHDGELYLLASYFNEKHKFPRGPLSFTLLVLSRSLVLSSCSDDLYFMWKIWDIFSQNHLKITLTTLSVYGCKRHQFIDWHVRLGPFFTNSPVGIEGTYVPILDWDCRAIVNLPWGHALGKF